MKKVFVLSSFLFSCLVAVSQPQEKMKVVNGAFERKNTEAKGAMHLPEIREADAVYSINVIRMIDLKQKQNKPLSNPSNSLGKHVLELMSSGKLEGYMFEETDFSNVKNIRTTDQINRALSDTSTFNDIDFETGREVTKTVIKKTSYEDIVKIRLKEEWVFDKQASSFQVRIIGLSLVRIKYNSVGDLVGDGPIAWIYYPALREHLAKIEMFNWKNDAAKFSFDDFFIKRLFGSILIQTPDVEDRRIEDITGPGIAALKEADKLKHVLVDFEQALWEY